MDMNLLIFIMAIKFYVVYGLASAVLGFWWAREAIEKAIQKRREDEEKHIFALLVAVFIVSVFIWPYILCATIKSSLPRKNESFK